MGKTSKKVALIAMSTALLIPATALGKSLTEDISITYRGIDITMDGSQVELKDAKGNAVEPFIYNGTTYLPVRAVSEAIGKEVLWDEYNNTVIMGEPGTIVVPEPPVVEAPVAEEPVAEETETNTSGHGIENPVALGTSQKVHVLNNIYEYDVDITINNVIRGAKANARVEAAFSANPAPDAGCEYVLAEATVALSNTRCFAENLDDKENVSISFWGFKGMSTDGTIVDTTDIMLIPQPELNDEAKSGETVSGYIVFQVKIGEEGMAVFGAPLGNDAGGTVFSID